MTSNKDYMAIALNKGLFEAVLQLEEDSIRSLSHLRRKDLAVKLKLSTETLRYKLKKLNIVLRGKNERN